MTRTAQSVSNAAATNQPTELDRLLDRMHEVITGASPVALGKLPALQAAIARAEAIDELKQCLDDDFMRRFYPLMNTALGFRCDRPSKKNQNPYSLEEVRGCFVEALLMGLRLTDNEWNIISGRVYVTREGFSRLLKDYPGLTDLRIEYGVPKGDPGKGVLVHCRASWLIGGVEDRLEADIPVRGDQYATIDQLLGKCDRKMKCRVYNRLTGSSFTAEGELDDEPVVNGAEDKAKQAQAAIEALKPQNGQAGQEAPKEPEQEPEPEKPKDGGWGRTTSAPKQEEPEKEPARVTEEESQVTQGTDAEQPQAQQAKRVQTAPAKQTQPAATTTAAPRRPWHNN